MASEAESGIRLLASQLRRWNKAMLYGIDLDKFAALGWSAGESHAAGFVTRCWYLCL